jgi:CBS domain-containing protein
MHAEGVRHAVVVRGRTIVGVVTDRDLGGLHGGRARVGRVVADLMQPSPVTASPRTTVGEAVAIVRARRIGCLPVVEAGRLVGIVTRADLLARLAPARPRKREIARRRSEEPARPLDVSPNIDKHT